MTVLIGLEEKFSYISLVRFKIVLYNKVTIRLENLSERHEDIFCSFELHLAPLQSSDGNINYANLSPN